MRDQLVWRLSWPLRTYLRRSPFQRGKGFLIRRALLPLLPPPPASFMTDLPGGGRVQLYYRETLGFVTLIYGGFERAELTAALGLASRGTTAFDVGSNVGLFAVVMSEAVGQEGTVIAVEPDPVNVRRLRLNLDLNEAGNVRVIEAAATDRDGSLTLHLADDSAYHSVATVLHARPSTTEMSVKAVRLDAVWRDLGEPLVSLMKIDVEGAEIPVLEGSRQILGMAHPALLLEAGADRDLEALTAFLAPLGYERRSRDGFMPWNHLFLWNQTE